MFCILSWEETAKGFSQGTCCTGQSRCCTQRHGLMCRLFVEGFARVGMRRGISQVAWGLPYPCYSLLSVQGGCMCAWQEVVVGRCAVIGLT